MKKTLTLLFAAAGIVLADAEKITLDWSGNTADISGVTFNKGEITVVLTLDKNAFASIAGNDSIFKVSGVSYGLDDSNNTVYGMSSIGISVADTDSIDSLRPWRKNTLLNGTGETMQGTMATLPLIDAEYATIVFYAYTSGANTKVAATLYYYNENYEFVDSVSTGTKEITLGQTRYSDVNDSYTLFEINSKYVRDNMVEIYNGKIADAEGAVVALIKTAGGSDGNIPEPTTATLSLMALAALAARRRRK